MNDSNLNTINDLKAFIDASKKGIPFKYQNQSETYQWIQDTLIKFEYMSLNKFEKGIIKQYIKIMS
ncbi:MAG: hypothetical protein ACI8Q2_000133, partial [Candidatus Omnitrophota bacterium]